MGRKKTSTKYRTGVCLETENYKFLALLQIAQPELDSISKVINYVIKQYAEIRPDIDITLEVPVKLKSTPLSPLLAAKQLRSLGVPPKRKPVLSKKQLEAQALENALVRIDRENKRRIKQKERDMQKNNLGSSIEEYLFGD